MITTKWIFIVVFQLLLHQSIGKPSKRLYGEANNVNNEDAVLDDLEKMMQDGPPVPSRDEMQDQYYQDIYASLPLKINFAVTPSDLRYYYPSSVLREASLHSSIYGLESLSPESRRAVEAIWDEAAQRHAYLAENYPDGLPQQYDNPPMNSQGQQQLQPSVHGSHGHSGGGATGHPDQQSHPDNPHKDNINYLQTSRQLVEQQLPHFMMNKNDKSPVLRDFYFVALVSGLTAVAVCTVIGAGICYFRLHKNKRDAAEAEYPAYGVTGPGNKDLSPGAADRKMAASAHMFHYQHQKQQMIALEKSSNDDRHCSASDVDSEEEGEEGDYTVYECPGLAPTGEMEVKNPLFSDDPTPATPHGKTTSTRGADDEKEDE